MVDVLARCSDRFSGSPSPDEKAFSECAYLRYLRNSSHGFAYFVGIERKEREREGGSEKG